MARYICSCETSLLIASERQEFAWHFFCHIREFMWDKSKNFCAMRKIILFLWHSKQVRLSKRPVKRKKCLKIRASTRGWNKRKMQNEKQKVGEKMNDSFFLSVVRCLWFKKGRWVIDWYGIGNVNYKKMLWWIQAFDYQPSLTQTIILWVTDVIYVWHPQSVSSAETTVLK